MAQPPHHTFEMINRKHKIGPTSGTTLWNSFWTIKMNGKIPTYDELFFATRDVQAANTNLIMKNFVGWEKFGGNLCHNQTTGTVSMPKGIYIFRVMTHDGYLYEWHLTIDTEQNTDTKRRSRKGAYLTNFDPKLVSTRNQFIGVPLSSIQAVDASNNSSSKHHKKKRKSGEVYGCNKKVCQEGTSNTIPLFCNISNDLTNYLPEIVMPSFDPFNWSIPDSMMSLYLEPMEYEQFLQNQTMFSFVPNKDANQVMFTSSPIYSGWGNCETTDNSNETINLLDEL